MKNIVIGSGPAGRLGSLELGKLGEEVTLIEKNHIAGTCLSLIAMDSLKVSSIFHMKK